MDELIVSVIVLLLILLLIRHLNKKTPKRISKKSSNAVKLKKYQVAEAQQSDQESHNFKKWDISDPSNQLRFVSDGNFHLKKPINKEAFKSVYAVVEHTLGNLKPKHRLLAEVPLGSFIGTSWNTGKYHAQRRAFKSINSKRLDFLVIDHFGIPKLAIEYHGTGHYQGNAVQRDEVKKVVLGKVGIPLLTLSSGVSRDEVEQKVLAILRPDQAIEEKNELHQLAQT